MPFSLCVDRIKQRSGLFLSVTFHRIHNVHLCARATRSNTLVGFRGKGLFYSVCRTAGVGGELAGVEKKVPPGTQILGNSLSRAGITLPRPQENELPPGSRPESARGSEGIRVAEFLVVEASDQVHCAADRYESQGGIGLRHHTSGRNQQSDFVPSL